MRIFVDGSCLGNPGKGGWAVVCEHGASMLVWVGSATEATNNRMELTAAIRGLTVAKKLGARNVELVTDSEYVRGMLNGWRASANQDLVQQLRALADAVGVTVTWVRGHSGHRENELADRLARSAAANQESGAWQILPE